MAEKKDTKVVAVHLSPTVHQDLKLITALENTTLQDKVASLVTSEVEAWKSRVEAMKAEIENKK